MGGNVHVIGRGGEEHAAQKLDLKKFKRADIRSAFTDLFLTLNKRFKEHTGKPIWKNESLIKTGRVFNGSSESFFNAGILDSVFVEVKDVVGDIDVTVPEDLKVDVWEFLKTIEGGRVTPYIIYVGNNVASPHGAKSQINAIFKYSNGTHAINMQVDFEFLPYDKTNSPTAFAKFSHSSSWGDLVLGLKGVHHKYILRALAGGASQRHDVQVITKARGQPQKNPDGVQFHKFSVDRGLRTGAYVPAMDNGVHRVVNGLPAYHAVEPKDSTYTTDVSEIARHMLGPKVTKAEIDGNMGSFIGVLRLMKKYLTIDQITTTLDRLQELYWAKGAQGFERSDPELDFKIKQAGWDLAMKAFPFYKSHNINTVTKSYYDNYRMTEISS